MRLEARDAGGAVEAGAAKGVAGQCGALPHSARALSAAAGGAEVGGGDEMSRDGAEGADARAGCMGVGGSAAPLDVGVEMRETKRRKRCTPRHNPHSLSRASAPGPAQPAVLSTGSGVEVCGSSVGDAGGDWHQGLEKEPGVQVGCAAHTCTAPGDPQSAVRSTVDGATAGPMPGANMFSDISESVLSDPQVLQLLEDPSGLEDLFADAELSWLVEPLTHHINAKLVAGDAGGGGGFGSPGKVPRTPDARARSGAAFEQAVGEKKSGCPANEKGKSTCGTNSGDGNREEVQGTTRAAAGEREAGDRVSQSALLPSAHEHVRANSAATGGGRVEISASDAQQGAQEGLEHGHPDAGSLEIGRASCLGMPERAPAVAPRDETRAGDGGGGGRGGGGGNSDGSSNSGGGHSEGGDRTPVGEPKHSLPANLDLDAFLRTLHASDAESV